MNSLSLIQGHFNTTEAADIISKLVEVKIKFHENKITNTSNEEDIKMQESRIKELQNDLAAVKKYLSTKDKVEISAKIELP